MQTDVAAVLQLELSSESEDRRAAYKESLAECYIAESRPVEALLLLKQLSEASRDRPENLALMADAQVRVEQFPCPAIVLVPYGFVESGCARIHFKGP